MADSLTGGPVEGVRVGVSQGNSLLGSGLTDAAGAVYVPVSPVGNAPVTLTITGRNVAPFQKSLTVGTPALLSQAGVAVTDNGNGDGLANPGETLELRVTLHNPGSQAVTSATGILEAVNGAEVVTGQVDFPSIPAGGSAASDQPFVVHVPEGAEEGTQISLHLAAVAGADTSNSLIHLPVQAPELRYESFSIGGGRSLLPGDTVSVTVTLRNGGSVLAPGVGAILRARNSEWISVVDSVATFGDIAVAGAAAGETSFKLTAGREVPIGQTANLTLILTTSAGARQESSFSIPIGRAEITSPLGPDGFGYWAYDNSDTDYPDTAPLYDWFECSTVYGGPGRRLVVADNKATGLKLPFPFRFYGAEYDTLQVCDNGWIAFDTAVRLYDFYNWNLPSPYGCGGRIAAFWDNLDPNKKVSGVAVGDGIYSYYDEAHHRFIIEWSRLGNTDQTATPPDPSIIFTDLQTFQIILYDPAHASDPGGKEGIYFQYKQILNVDQTRMYSTVGIENMERTGGLQYTYSNIYPVQAAPLSAGLAIHLTTEKPRYSPFRLSAFNAAPAGQSVGLSWTPVDARPRGAYRVYRAVPGGEFRCVAANLGSEAVGYIDVSANPASSYQYRIGSLDPVGRETLLGPFAYEGSTAGTPALALVSKTSNPFRGGCELTYSVPRPVEVALRVYNVSGRLVRTLARGTAATGSWTARWDGRDENGRTVSAGIYFARLQAGEERRELKLITVR